jgi:hypothetical protein
MSGNTLAPTTPTNMRISGITTFTVNGTTLQVVDFVWDPATGENEMISSLSGVDGYKQKPVAPFVSGKYRDGRQVSVTNMTNLTAATIVINLANGKQIVGHNMVYTGRPGVSGADADFDFKFEGIAGCLMEVGGPS